MDISQVYDKLKPIVDGMSRSVTCDSITTNTDGTFTFVCKYTKWAVSGFSVTIGLIDYLITNVVPNVSITVSGVSIPLQLTFDLPVIHFKHGSIRQVATELNTILNVQDRLPLIFLHEISEEKVSFDVMDSVDTEADCKLYFLTGNDFQNWSQNEIDVRAIKPMRNMAREFIEAISDNQYIAPIDSPGTIRNYSQFGSYNDVGVVKSYFNEPLSGVGLRVTIPFLKGCDCCTNSPLETRPAPSYVYDVNGNILAILYSNEIYIDTIGNGGGGGGGGGSVTIKNINTGTVITTVNCGSEYFVEQLTEIVDTLTNNTTTIIDPLT